MARVINSNIVPVETESDAQGPPQAGAGLAPGTEAANTSMQEQADDSPATRALLACFGPDVRVLRRPPPAVEQPQS